MYRAIARSRPALMLRRVRGRFGMLAPRVTVRAHIPWYWRVLVTILLLAAAILMASWVYDIGRQFAGFDKSIADQELSALRERVAVLEADSAHDTGTDSEASMQIEHTAQQKLGEQVKKLEIENGRLREDMAAFESLASGEEKNEIIGIRRMQVEPDVVAGAGAYRYRLLLAAPASRSDREFKGWLQLVATIQQGGKTVTVNIPDTAVSGAQKHLIDFKYFRRIEGVFTLPPNAVLKKLEARLMQGATVVNSRQILM